MGIFTIGPDEYKKKYYKKMEELNTDSQIINSIDMNGNGIKLIDFNNSNTIFVVDNDGLIQNTGWVDERIVAKCL